MKPRPLLADSSGPLYERVRQTLERMALGRPLHDDTPLPPEPALMDTLGVSRGTLRRAIEELTRDGLLVAEQGRGTFVDPEERVRRVVWKRLLAVARPDSRFDLDLRQFVPDFAGREQAEDALLALETWQSAETVFVTPDNSLEHLRELALQQGKRLLVPTFGLRRGFMFLDGTLIEESERKLASTLDGMERFGGRLGPADLRSVGRVDVVVTGATAITVDGRHIGGGQRYLAVEWALLERLGVVDARVPVVGVVHDCQVLDEIVRVDPDCMIDLIVTPRLVVSCHKTGQITRLPPRRQP